MSTLLFVLSALYHNLLPILFWMFVGFFLGITRETAKRAYCKGFEDGKKSKSS